MSEHVVDQHAERKDHEEGNGDPAHPAAAANALVGFVGGLLIQMDIYGYFAGTWAQCIQQHSKPNKIPPDLLVRHLRFFDGFCNLSSREIRKQLFGWASAAQQSNQPLEPRIREVINEACREYPDPTQEVQVLQKLYDLLRQFCDHARSFRINFGFLERAIERADPARFDVSFASKISLVKILGKIAFATEGIEKNLCMLKVEFGQPLPIANGDAKDTSANDGAEVVGANTIAPRRSTHLAASAKRPRAEAIEPLPAKRRRRAASTKRPRAEATEPLPAKRRRRVATKSSRPGDQD